MDAFVRANLDVTGALERRREPEGGEEGVRVGGVLG